MRPALLLAANAAAQLAFSSALGWAMLLPLQPWGEAFRPYFPRGSMLAAHMDWIILGLCQFAASWCMDRWPETESRVAARLLVFGGWVNPTAYVFRGFGVDAFVLEFDSAVHVAATLLSGASAACVLVGWCLLASSLWSVAAGAKEDEDRKRR